MVRETIKGRNYMDAPNARPSDEAYEDALSRYGTPQFTDTDAAMVSRWRQDHPDWDKEASETEAQASEYDGSDREEYEDEYQGEDYGSDSDYDPSLSEEEVETSPGTSSSTSSGKTAKRKK